MGSLLSAMGTDGGKEALCSASAAPPLWWHTLHMKLITNFRKDFFFSRVFAFVPSVGKGRWGMLLVISVQKSKDARQGSYSSAAGPLAGS